ncbi:hypothetical protein P5P86_12775 [Nocardioides sp. BP30]|uniref:hypothetical protein n=1 Tax=Nocardioides sp. BP30 TaxID=3036374 RepID=UPI0024683852|nr:hypothetical protein [Nocardioides sp. BP30]WGL50837.1 hypothetical protein P5P86_12775 [Nocardioides sp. BP30]
MPVIAEATAQARLLARRGANAAAVVIGASFHPFRTVRDGATVVRGLVSPPADPVPGAPTDAAEQPASPPSATSTPPSASTKTGSAKKPAEPKTPPGPDIVAKPVAPPAQEASNAVVGEQQVDDRPVEARGPVPHLPPQIAAEIERDYGDDLPGITDGPDQPRLTDEEG